MMMSRVFARLKLLVIDDNPLMAELLRAGLESHFSLIVVASGVEQAKALVGGPFHFSAFVCDYCLRDGNGLEFYQWLRTEQHNASPLIMISGEVPPITQDDPNYAFIAKPFPPEAILRRLEQFELPVPAAASLSTR